MPVPSSIFVVTVPAMARAVRGSGRSQPRPIASKTHALSKPADSI
jgi:hypothetical protein